MDCDLILPKNFIQTLVKTHKENPDCVIGVYRRFLGPSSTAKVLTGQVSSLSAIQEFEGEDHEENQGYRGVLGYCQAVSRQYWQKVGYPEEFDNIAQSDVAFNERLLKIGCKPLFLRQTEVLHLHHERNWNGTERFL